MRSISSRGSLIFTYICFNIWVRRGIWHFQNYDTAVTFYPLENVLSPEGSCESRTEGGPIVFTYVLFWLGNDFDTFKITLLRWPFFFLKMFYFRGGWDWMGWDGPSKGSIKLKLISFFVARSLPYRLPSGSVLTFQNEAVCAMFPGGMGWGGVGWGWTGYQKCPSIFFILCGYIDHLSIYLHIYSKVVRTDFWWV